MVDFDAGEVREAAEELRKALGVDHPLGLAAPQLGKGLRMVWGLSKRCWKGPLVLLGGDRGVGGGH